VRRPTRDGVAEDAAGDAHHRGLGLPDWIESLLGIS